MSSALTQNTEPYAKHWQLSLNTATVKQLWNLEQIIEGCQRHQILGLAPWRDQVKTTGLKKAARLIKQAGLVVTGYCRGGMFTASNAAGQKQQLADNFLALEEAAELEALCLILVVGGVHPAGKNLSLAYNQIQAGVLALKERANELNVPLALEPLHPMYAADRACLNSLSHANEWAEKLDVSIAIDVYHLWWEAGLHQQIQKSGNRIVAYHICDWLLDTQDFLLDRGMMGDGVIDLPQITQSVLKAGYKGFFEVEIFSKNHWWKTDPDQVLKTCKQRHQQLLDAVI